MIHLKDAYKHLGDLSAKMVARDIYLIRVLVENRREIFKRRISSDLEISKLSDGLVEVDADDKPIDNESIHHVHLLKRGARYMAELRPNDQAGHVTNSLGKIAENEVALAIKNTLDPHGDFIRLQRKI